MNREAGQETPGVEAGWLRAVVLRAGAILRDAADRHREVRVDRKGRIDLVTETDLAIQEQLLRDIGTAFPDDCIVAEEGDPASEISGGAVWYVDPLDGTTNFVHGHPFCAVSLARWIDGEPEVGAVYAPLLDELFTARRDGGALFERPAAGIAPRAISCSDCRSLDDALVATGFPYHRGATARLNLAICARALARVHGVRRGGSAALDLCHVALGRLDGYWEMGLNDWDIAAAALVAREAGAVVTDFTGAGEILGTRRVAAAGPSLHGGMLEMIAAAHHSPDLDPLGPLPAGTLSLSGPLPTEMM